MTEQKNNFTSSSLSKKWSDLGLNRGILFTLIILTALLAFESFNFSTTNFALADLLGNLTFAGLSWATILSIAFCGIDFAGIARLFTSERTSGETTEVWYLFGAWMLAATMNAILTWWAVSLALENHVLNSTTVLDQSTLIKAVPVFVALMVWLIRILIIGSLSMAGDRLIGHGNRHHFNHYSEPIKTYNPHPAGVRTTTPASAASSANIPVSSFQPSPRMAMRHDAATSRQVIPIRNNETSPSRNEARKNPLETPAGRPEPVYQPLSTGSKTSSQINLM